MYNFLKILVSYFRTIEIYEVHNRSSFKASKEYEFKIYKNDTSDLLKKKSKNIMKRQLIKTQIYFKKNLKYK